MQRKELSEAGACTLGRVFGYEPTISRRLIDAAGSIEALFSLPESARDELLGPYSVWRGKISDAELEKSFLELEKLRARGFRFISQDDPLYPELLKECEDAPAGLYIRSSSEMWDIFDDTPFVSIVGTRDISAYGKEWCRRIVFTLATAPVKPVIVSGMALGVDGTAHQAALEAGLRTIGVMPTGIDEVYPEAHRRMAEQITFTPGSALITDFPPSTQPQASTFLRRNRIIAGLSGATILVESRKRGGGLITANTAFSYGREVYAVPGRLDDSRSEGCNILMQRKIAENVGNIAELPEALGLGRWRRRKKTEIAEEVTARYSGKLPDAEVSALRAVASYIRGFRGADPEQISNALGIDYIRTTMLVGKLVADGFVEQDLCQRCSIIVRIE